jgi:hypothetical protein
MINSPEMRRRANHLVNYLREESSLSKKVQELVMILTARSMDQDLLPVLLAVRALRRAFTGYLFHAWPGIELTCGRDAVDVDLLAHGAWVACCEVKATASGLKEPQLADLICLCEHVGARPCIAALEGSFPEAVAQEIRRRDGLVFERSDLLAA